jgi:hypothetical protein
MKYSFKYLVLCVSLAVLVACSSQDSGYTTADSLKTASGATTIIAIQATDTTIVGTSPKRDLLANLAIAYPGGSLPPERAAQAAEQLAQNPAVLKYNANNATSAQSLTVSPQATDSYTVGLSSPVQRAQNTTLFGSYFFSIYPTEMTNALSTNPTWNLEGTAFHASLGINPGLAPVYRFRNLINGSYLYTINEGEKSDIIANYSATFTLEGTAWYASPVPAAGYSALYRFRNLTNGTYLFSAYEAEKDAIVANYAGIFLLEGVSYYVRQTAPLELSLVAGSGTFGSTEGVGAAAQFGNPEGMAFDYSDGSIYVADRSLHVIRKIHPSGLVTTLAGMSGVSGTADGVGSSARFNAPWGLLYPAGSTGLLIVTDSGNHTVRLINTLTGVVSTPLGMPGAIGSADGVGNLARFYNPRGITQSLDGNYFVIADASNHTIRRISRATAGVSTLAGAVGVAGSTNGMGVAARFRYPQGVTYDTLGQLFVADLGNCAIRIVTSAGFVGAAAGIPGSCMHIDGTATTARFITPWSITANPMGGVYIADDYSVRKMTADGVVTTVVGTLGATTFEEGLLPSKTGRYINSLMIHPNMQLLISMESGNRVIKVNALP